ncbi:sulfatase [Phragmitibacter flavus]|uniref:Sulfatase n=1 Tax=Phragmitibacter flavus TaxID=2576071 RepID=A0A5R8K9K2_9BACT|nr:sulfatase [Phragmitibacter flavus]
MRGRWVLILILVSASWPGLANGAERPHVLLICVDDLKPALGCYGDKLAKTPNMDRLAARGMRFDLAYCNQAVCAPSRNNLMLGSRSTSLGIYGLNRNFREAVPEAMTLPQSFRKAGYLAESYGKVFHTGHGNREDEASWSRPPLHDKIIEYVDPANSAGGRLTREEAYFTNRELGRIKELPRGSVWEELEVEDEAYADGRVAKAVVERLREVAKEPGQPVFLAAGFARPHLPFTAPKKYWEMFDPQSFELPRRRQAPDGAPAYAGKTLGELNNYDPVPQHPPLSEAMRRRLMQGYYAGVSYVDAQVGKILDELDRLGLADKTVIVLWGDHGWHLGDLGMWTKHTNYEQANRIPLVMVAPGVMAKGSVTRQLAETVDVYPTLVELAGLPVVKGPQPMDGVSLVPVLRDPKVRVRDHAYHCFPRGKRMGRAIRTERYRLVEWKEPGADAETAEWELYDYEMEEPEARNLAEEQLEVIGQLRQILAGHPEAKLLNF